MPPVWARSAHVRSFATYLGKKLSSEIIATYLGEKLSIEIIATYLGEKLSHETVPLSAIFIFEPVGSVVHPLERVVELWDTHKN